MPQSNRQEDQPLKRIHSWPARRYARMLGRSAGFQPGATAPAHGYPYLLIRPRPHGLPVAPLGLRFLARLIDILVVLVLNVVGNAVYTLVIAHLDPEPYPSVADFLYLAAYPAMYVALTGLIRSRVTRFQASMWLDGLVGGFGAGGVAIALLLRPALRITEGDPAYDRACPGPTAGRTLLQILAPCPSDGSYDSWFADPASQPVHDAL